MAITHIQHPKSCVLQFPKYRGIKFTNTFIKHINIKALRSDNRVTNQEMKEANSTLFQFHLQGKSNDILLCDACLTTCNMLDFHQTQTEHSLKGLWNTRNICIYLTSSNSLAVLIGDSGPALERQWAPRGHCRLSAPFASDKSWIKDWASSLLLKHPHSNKWQLSFNKHWRYNVSTDRKEILITWESCLFLICFPSNILKHTPTIVKIHINTCITSAKAGYITFHNA